MDSGKSLADDCFALPPGVDWTPVDVALARLREGMAIAAGVETVPAASALGRILAAPVLATRANPPMANAAVDGYGLAHASLADDGAGNLELLAGRAAAGAPFNGAVPAGAALRILTGALVSDGVDSIVMQEDVTLTGGRIHFKPGLKPGANVRRAGEDVAAGAEVLPAGRRLRAPDLALIAAVGVARLQVFKTLRVGVLSSGDELCTPGAPVAPHQTYDANRPMLLAMAQAFGHEAIDLGHVGDDPAALKTALNGAAARCDAILTSGGASAGDEDHLSAVISAHGSLQTWRVAMKPGRPLALGLWPAVQGRNVPVFGLPGNPVAACICALVMARPALSVLAGAGWLEPAGQMLPAAFAKTKKAGRREYLRARLNADGTVAAYHSEGSGRISGLAWADGLVELPDAAGTVTPGDLVRYISFAAFGL
ncbi:MAG: gephyrin-like molybdotransferase Glp [Paracoccaceae bacterium]